MRTLDVPKNYIFNTLVVFVIVACMGLQFLYQDLLTPTNCGQHDYIDIYIPRSCTMVGVCLDGVVILDLFAIIRGTQNYRSYTANQRRCHFLDMRKSHSLLWLAVTELNYGAEAGEIFQHTLKPLRRLQRDQQVNWNAQHLVLRYYLCMSLLKFNREKHCKIL